MLRNVTARRAIDRFIEYNRRPFKAADVANDTGIHPKTVRNLLPQFVREGLIRVMLREQDGNIYGKVPKLKRTTRSGQQYDWVPREKKLRHFYELAGEHRLLADIKKNTPYSVETTYRYLRILVADGCLEKYCDIIKQVEFKPRFLCWSEYMREWKEQQESLSEEEKERKELIEGINYFSELSGVSVPDYDEKTPIERLRKLHGRRLCDYYGLKSYDQG